MKRTVVNGIVKKVEVMSGYLSFVTLTPIPMAGEVDRETRVPVYMQLDQGFVGKPADIITVRSGFFGQHFKQTVEAADRSHRAEMPYSLVKRINDSYRRAEDSGLVF